MGLFEGGGIGAPGGGGELREEGLGLQGEREEALGPCEEGLGFQEVSLGLCEEGLGFQEVSLGLCEGLGW